MSTDRQSIEFRDPKTKQVFLRASILETEQNLKTEQNFKAEQNLKFKTCQKGCFRSNWGRSYICWRSPAVHSPLCTLYLDEACLARLLKSRKWQIKASYWGKSYQLRGKPRLYPFDVYPVPRCTLIPVPAAACCRWRISRELQIL